MDRKALDRLLYNASRIATAEHWRNDSEKVREVRDMTCLDMYGQDYKHLSDKEVECVINALNEKAGNANEHFQRHANASPKQTRLLRFYAMMCAIHYCKLDGLVCTEYKESPDGDKVYYEWRGETLRDWLKNQFGRKGGYVPNNAFRHLHNGWINPHAHKFLIEGSFKLWTNNASRFHYEQLTPQEATYLINRFREISDNLKMKVTIEDAEEIANLN